MQEASGNREVLSLTQAAEFLGVDDRTLRDWMKLHGVPFTKVGGLLRFRRSALLQWLRERDQGADAQVGGSIHDHEFLQQLRPQDQDAAGLRFWLAAQFEGRNGAEALKKVVLGSVWAALEPSIQARYREDMAQLLRAMHMHDKAAADFAEQVFAEVHRPDGDQGGAAGAGDDGG